MKQQVKHSNSEQGIGGCNCLIWQWYAQRYQSKLLKIPVWNEKKSLEVKKKGPETDFVAKKLQI